MSEPTTTVFRIDAMDCPTEAELLRKEFEGMPGIIALEFDLLERRLSLQHSLPGDDAIVQAIRKLGMEPVVVTNDHGSQLRATTTTGRASQRSTILSLALAGVFALTAEALAYGLQDERSLWVLASAAIAIVLGGRGTARKGWIALRAWTLNINLLMSIAVLGALGIGEWPEAAMVVWLFGVAEALEAMSLDRARDAIRGLLTLVPETVSVRHDDGTWSEVSASTVDLGAQVRFKPGERIAFDGTVIAGHSTVNQAPITGESVPVEKQVGEVVFAGSLNERGAIEIQVTSRKGDTTLDRIAKTVQSGYAQRAPTQRFVDQFARYYTPAVLFVAIAVALGLPLGLGQPWRTSIYTALVLLVIACPCALVISTPVTVVSGLAAAARRGILAKGGLYLELGHRLKFLAMDKTGTLTHGTPALTDIVTLRTGMSTDEALEIAATLNALSEHPVASAIVKGYHGKPIKEVTAFEALAGRGVKGRIGDTMWFLGNHRLAEEIKICSPALEEVLDGLERQAKTAVVLATGHEAVAVIAVSDTVRDSSREAVGQLKAMGVKVVMLTGDNSKTAQAVAALVGIDEAYGDLLPDEKLAAVSALAKSGSVGMVGDGINDAPALARADIGFAMGAAGTDTAIETADVALMTDDLRKIPEFIRLSKQAHRIMWQNVTFAIAVKVVFFALTLSGYSSLWLAVFADMGASLIVVGNALRPLRN